MDAEDPDNMISPSSSDADIFSGGEMDGPINGEQVAFSELPHKSSKITPRLVLLVVVAAVGGFLFGYDTSAVGGALQFIKVERQQEGLPPLSPFMLGLIPAATPFGAVFGALCAGILADRFGRKPTVMLASVVFTMGAGVMAFSPDVWVLVVGRLIVGVGVGIVSMTVPVYLSECSPESIRGAVVSINVLFITTGQFCAYVISLLLANADYQWRWILGLSGVPAILQFVGMLFLTETPRWLITQGLLADAKRALISIRGDAAVAARDVREICIAVKSEPRGTLAELVLDWVNRRALLISCGVLILQQLCAINTVMYYVPEILALSGTTNVPLWSLLPAGTNAIGTVVGIVLVDRMGRRWLLLTSIVGVILTLLAFGLVSKFTPQYTVWTLVAYLLAFSPGLGPVPWAISSEVFSVKIRGLGMAIATASNWLANFVISVTFPIFTDDIGLANAVFGYCILAVGTFVFVFFLVPETKGKTLEEVQVMLKENPYPTRACSRNRKTVKI